MDAKNSFVGLLLLIFALPCLSTIERDFITPAAIQAILQKTSSDFNFMLSEDAFTSKIVVADNLVLEEALKMMTRRRDDEKLGGIPCGETCVFSGCYSVTFGCACEKRVCYKNSLPS